MFKKRRNTSPLNKNIYKIQCVHCALLCIVLLFDMSCFNCTTLVFFDCLDYAHSPADTNSLPCFLLSPLPGFCIRLWIILYRPACLFIFSDAGTVARFDISTNRTLMQIDCIYSDRQSDNLTNKTYIKT